VRCERCHEASIKQGMELNQTLVQTLKGSHTSVLWGVRMCEKVRGCENGVRRNVRGCQENEVASSKA
jgi:hypothetical protein